jgi:hypothetical protein
MPTPPLAQEPADEVVEHNPHHHDAPCECGHRNAEHSIFGSCHGCTDCSDDDDLEAEHSHPYARCACKDFRFASMTADDEAGLALTG